MSITEIYTAKCNSNSDICQHLPTLRKYAYMCDSIVELGVRSIVSTWAFLLGKPKTLISVDIIHPSKYVDYDQYGCNLELVYKLAEGNGIDFKFIEQDSLKIELPEVDMVFFDTLHTYEQLSQELRLHGNKAKKYLIFHDTETYKDELIPAINGFLLHNTYWGVHEKFDYNNGLLILKHI